VTTKTKIRNEAQFSALNDCTYRSMYNYQYTILVDLDEYLIPRGFTDLKSYLHSKDNSNIGSFLFKNGFFYLYWENTTLVGGQSVDNTPYLITMFKTRRMTKLHNYGTRSKYIVKPEKVIEAGNHLVWKHVKGSNVYKVPENEGISHHYRICEFGGFECKKHPSVLDNTTHRWSSSLIPNVIASCEQIFGELGCPAAEPLGSPW